MLCGVSSQTKNHPFVRIKESSRTVVLLSLCSEVKLGHPALIASQTEALQKDYVA